MDVRVCRIRPDKQSEISSFEEFLRHRKESEDSFWIDVTAPSSAELVELLSPLEFHPLILERCGDTAALSGVLHVGGCVLVQFALQMKWDDPERRLISIVCLPRSIVTVHAERLSALETLSGDLPALLGHHRLSTSAILYVMLDRVIDGSVEQGLEARRAVDELETAMRAEVESDEIGGTILELKRMAAHLEITLEEQHRCLTALLSMETEAFSAEGVRHYFRDAISHLEHSLRYVQSIEARLSELHQQYLLVLQGRTNDRLKILTILSAVFMPLSLIASIYGMNFRHMPEIDLPYGYPVTLVVMLGLAGGLLWFFYRRGWFD
jgi:magnesium transporter